MTSDLAARMDVQVSQATFRVLLSTLSRPGRIEQLPRPADGPSAIPLALADLFTPVAVVGDPARLEQICEATGAPVAGARKQAELVAFWRPPRTEDIARCRRGSALDPEHGAKIGLCCDRLVPPGPADAGAVALQLSGPGVEGTRSLGVLGLSAEVFSAIAERNGDFPAGIDCWLVDRTGAIVAISRSSVLEVR